MLRLVGQMRSPVLHLRDLAFRIARRLPLVVRHLLLACPVEAASVLIGRILDSLLGEESLEIRLVVFAGVLADDVSHGRIGLERGRVDRHRLASQQLPLVQQLEHEDEHLLVNLHRQPFANPRVRLECSGVDSPIGTPRKLRRLRLSAHRQAMPRWLSMPSK